MINVFQLREAARFYFLEEGFTFPQNDPARSRAAVLFGLR